MTKADNKTFPVKLEKNYRPVGEFMIERSDEDGTVTLDAPTEVELQKVPAGSVIHVAVEEARSIIDKKIALRNDPIN